MCRGLYGVNQGDEFMQEITVLFRGLKRHVTKEKQGDKGKFGTGKVPVSFSLYHCLNEYILRDNSLDSIFARASLTTPWNLICHATNTCAIHLHHMDWQNDLLYIYFAHMKNNQVDNRKRDPRHIYSNPIDPKVCPILSLSIYFSVFNIIGTKDSTLFPRENQYKRFSKYLKKICTKYEDKILRDFQTVIEDIGVHSLWEGATSYVRTIRFNMFTTTSTVPYLPTSEPDGLWVSFKALIYVHYKVARYQYVGRAVSDLPVSSPKNVVIQCWVHTPCIK